MCAQEEREHRRHSPEQRRTAVDREGYFNLIRIEESLLAGERVDNGKFDLTGGGGPPPPPPPTHKNYRRDGGKV